MTDKPNRRGVLVAGLATGAGLFLAAPGKAEQKKTTGAYRRIRDVHKLTDIERTHSPLIRIPGGDHPPRQPIQITVSVGRRLHDMEPGHFIQWVTLELDGKEIWRTDLSPHGAVPHLSVYVLSKETATLRARALCNLHGYWEDEAVLKIGKA